MRDRGTLSLRSTRMISSPWGPWRDREEAEAAGTDGGGWDGRRGWLDERGLKDGVP